MTGHGGRARLDRLRECIGDQLAALETLVMAESPSQEPAAVASCAQVVDRLGTELLGESATRPTSDAPTLRWDLPGDPSAPRVLLLAHLDTVWPLGTTARWPFHVASGRATGPGVFDMKAGLVQALFALRDLDTAHTLHPPVTLLVTSDEEIGSPAGRAQVEHAAAGAGAALVLEASAGGAVKTARKGTGTYRCEITGRAAHAGLEPERGVNALTAAARLVLAAAELADPAAGTTVTPTLASAGSTTNTVPAQATVTLDVRAATLAEQHRIDAALRRLEIGAPVRFAGGMNRPPLEPSASAGLLPLATDAARSLGLAPLRGVPVGGGSDGNFTAAAGVPTLDGLGGVGDHAHAEGEYILVNTMPERAALLAELLVRIGRPQGMRIRDEA